MSEIAPDFDQEEEGAGSPDMDAARTMLFPDAPDDEEEQLDEEQLDEEGAADDGGSSDDGAGGDEPAAPSSLAELAELAGLDVADLYDIPIAVNGAQEPTTLRALTELATQDTAAIERERESLDQQRTDFENQILQERATLQRVMAMLGPQNLTAEVIAQAQGMHQAYMDGGANGAPGGEARMERRCDVRSRKSGDCRIRSNIRLHGRGRGERLRSPAA